MCMCPVPCLQVDDAVWTEVRNFQKTLIQMWMAQGKEVLFMETALGLSNLRGGRHAVMEAIPLDPQVSGPAGAECAAEPCNAVLQSCIA